MKEKESRELASFQILANEIAGTDPSKTRARIRRKLQRSGLGEYDEAQVDQLRRLRDDLEQEITKFDRSKYFTPSASQFASLENFQSDRLARDFCERYPTVDKIDMAGIVGFALYYYYLR